MKPMKILIINTDYSEFLEWLYEQHPGLAERSYDEQMRARNESLFGLADFYSSNLKKLGHEARDIYANNHIMQSAWVRRRGGQPVRHCFRRTDHPIRTFSKEASRHFLDGASTPPVPDCPRRGTPSPHGFRLPT